jgi:hypothetical protein
MSRESSCPKYGSLESSAVQILDNPESLLVPVLKRIRYSADTISEPLRERSVGLIELGLQAIHVDFVERIARIGNWAGGSICAEGISIESVRWSALLDHMKSPERVYCFALTLGGEFDDLVEEKRKRSLFDAYVLDALGSHVAEYFADRVGESVLASPSLRGLDWSHRFSPGYCDWDLSRGQRAVFQFVQPGRIGIEVLPSGTMIPAKSVSAVMIGAGEAKIRCPCRFCEDAVCQDRRAD